MKVTGKDVINDLEAIMTKYNLGIDPNTDYDVLASILLSSISGMIGITLNGRIKELHEFIIHMCIKGITDLSMKKTGRNN